MSNKLEYEEKYADRFYGKRRARVSDNQDPEKRGRVRVNCVDLYGASESPWALPCFPFYGGRDCGFFSIPPIGSLVWLECEEGHVGYPIYTGGFFPLITDGHSSDGSFTEDSEEFQNEPSSAPAHGRGDYDGMDFGGMKGNQGVPYSAFEGEYGQVTILQTPKGHVLEFDDTDGAERIQIHHRVGSHIEILPDGTVHIIAEGNILTKSEAHKQNIYGDRTSEVMGSSSDVINGDFSTKLGGDSSYIVGGGSTIETGSMSVTISDNTTLTGGGLSANLSNLFEVVAGGEINLTSFSNFEVFSSGKGYFSFSNALGIPEPTYITPALNLVGVNGTSKMTSGDPTGLISVYGVEARGGTGGQVYIGGLNPVLRVPTLGIGAVPLLKEPAVLGTQLQLFMEAVLTSLSAFFSTMSTGGSTPLGGPNFILGAASVTAGAAITTAKTTFLNTPSPTQPLILSEAVYLSKV
tara:strand:+ start:347 stop:1738 length:1392 start_codon:yes stop_codon:yes gene_type:complete